MHRDVRGALRSDQGIGLVSSMLALSLLAVFALVAAGLALNARRTTFNELTHVSALLSADSGGEAAIGFLKQNARPPVVTDMDTGLVNAEQSVTLLPEQDQAFSYDLKLRGAPRARPGYTYPDFQDFFYRVEAKGEAGVNGESNIGLIVSRLTKMNYN